MDGLTGGPGAVVAITPAHDEAAHIERLIDSVLDLDRRPDLWVIVDDASTDGTGAICDRRAADHGFIHVLHRRRAPDRRLSSKADAVTAGYEHAAGVLAHFGFVASIDGDVELPPEALSFVLDRFAEHPRLGITGGVYRHPVDGEMVVNRTGPVHVPGPFQVFRREVYDAIGGYQPLPDGGLDVVSTARARMLGWQTRAWPELAITHNRRVGTGGGVSPLVAEYRNGIRDHSMGTGLAFELAKCAVRLTDRPRVVGATVRLAGYLGAALRRRPRGVPADVGAFIRREHRARLRQQLRPGSPAGAR